MYIIKMSNDKSLLTTISQPIYQGENNSNTIDFFIPYIYENRELNSAVVRLDYILPNGVSGFKILEKDVDEYDNYTLYHLVITSDITYLIGRVKFWLTLLNNTNDMILKTSQNYFDVIESINVTYGISQIDEIEKQIQELNDKKADNISITKDQKIQLTSNSKQIGDYIQINEIINIDKNIE